MLFRSETADFVCSLENASVLPFRSEPSRTTLARATARLSQQSTEVANLRLLCVDLGAEAAAARAEAQLRQSELDQVTSERDQSRGRAVEAESRAETLGVQLVEASARARALAADLAVAQAESSEQRARARGIISYFLIFLRAKL